MKFHHKHFISGALLAIYALSLTACGGASSKSGITPTDHPKFYRSQVTTSPSYAPSGNITSTTPTFSWQAIAGATNYRFGHENTNDDSVWREYYASPAEAGCLNAGDTCSYTPTDYSIIKGEEKVWWVQASVNSNWQDWSRPILFTVVNTGTNPNSPTPIAPSGSINTTNPEFSWVHLDGATAYKIGHEDTNTQEGWQEHLISAVDANCQSGQACTYTLANTGFIVGQPISWWVKSQINGDWSNWSEGAYFNIGQTQAERPFIFNIELNSSSNTAEFTILTEGTGYYYNIDCDSDGSLEASGLTNDYTCQYNNSGNYRVTISGEFPQFKLGGDVNNSALQIDIEQWGTQKWRSMKSAFRNIHGELLFSSIDIPDFSQLTSMDGMFSSATNFNQDISHWDVSHVTNMKSLFAGAENFNQDIGNWDTSNVRVMTTMFSRATKFNQDIGNWNTSNVADINGMFSFATSFNQDIGNWDTSKVRGMFTMFDNAYDFDQDLSMWDVRKVRGMGDMFKGVTLSTENYDNLLNQWSQQDINSNVVFNGGQSKYSSAAKDARDTLINDHGWNISDGGQL